MSGPPAPKVSILCTAYNHGAYIRAALEGFVSQVTDFPFEVVVHDDASTDGTADIIREYEQLYPQIVRPIYQTENQYSRERGRVTRLVHAAARGTYLAMCEGDDYWIDPHKLQDQVGMLQKDPSLAGCFSDAWSETDGVREPFHPLINDALRAAGGTDLDGILLENFIPTASMLMPRDRLLPPPPQLFTSPAGDWVIQVHLAKQGRLGYLDRKTAVRRRHVGGAVSMKSMAQNTILTAACLRSIRSMVPPVNHDRIDERIAHHHRRVLDRYLSAGDLRTARHVWSTFRGQGFPWRERWRWWALIHLPALMRVYGGVRSRT